MSKFKWQLPAQSHDQPPTPPPPPKRTKLAPTCIGLRIRLAIYSFTQEISAARFITENNVKQRVNIITPCLYVWYFKMSRVLNQFSNMLYIFKKTLHYSTMSRSTSFWFAPWSSLESCKTLGSLGSWTKPAGRKNIALICHFKKCVGFAFLLFLFCLRRVSPNKRWKHFHINMSFD